MPPITLNGDTGIQTPMYNGTITANAVTPSVNMKNRIINGAMVIDQRNNGASVTISSIADITYTLDRWGAYGSATSKFSVQQNAGSVTPPVGFSKYLGVTSASAYTAGASEFFYIQQRVEGFNFADLDWGTANAKTVTLSFWVRSSLTGTFGGAVINSVNARSYPFTYTISAANTWELKTITIAGDTSGTWIGATNGVGAKVSLSLGAGATVSGTANTWAGATYYAPTGATSVVGTNGATFYITGCQLEVGSTATSFDYRQYQQELALAQRYYYKMQASAINSNFSIGYNTDTTNTRQTTFFPTSLRVAPTAIETTGTASNYLVANASGNPVLTSVPSFSSADIFSASFAGVVASGLTAGQAAALRSATSSAYLAWSAEL